MGDTIKNDTRDTIKNIKCGFCDHVFASDTGSTASYEDEQGNLYTVISCPVCGEYIAVSENSEIGQLVISNNSDCTLETGEKLKRRFIFQEN